MRSFTDIDALVGNIKRVNHIRNASAKAANQNGLMLYARHIANANNANALDSAYKCFARAAKRGYGGAYYNLGIIEELRGDIFAASDNFAKAADFGIGAAQYEWAQRLREGRGLKSADYASAMDFYRRAAENKEPMSCLYMASLYLEGGRKGIGFKNAVIYLIRASALGDRRTSQAAMKHLRHIQKKLIPKYLDDLAWADFTGLEVILPKDAETFEKLNVLDRAITRLLKMCDVMHADHKGRRLAL